jgi:pentose-5-phosphate-3-epimerase
MKAAMSKMKNVEDLASRQVTLFGQMEIAFGEATPEQIEKATALIMRMDLACDRPQRRTEDFKRIMEKAVTVVRTNIPDDVDRVLKYLIKHASDSSIVNDPDYVISTFDDYLNKTKQLVSSPL